MTEKRQKIADDEGIEPPVRKQRRRVDGLPVDDDYRWVAWDRRLRPMVAINVATGGYVRVSYVDELPYWV